MLSNLKRRPLLVFIFCIQCILLSTYTYVKYLNNVKTDVDPLIEPLKPDRLPASLLENSDRILVGKNYKTSKLRPMREENYSRTKEKFEALNISFVNDIDKKQTIIECPILPTNLVGRVSADLFSYSMEEVEEHLANSNIELGGHWTPSHCTARQRVAIIIPYRNREMQLRIFLNFMHPFLQKQQLDYQIFLLEPVEGITFNRAILFNIGFRETMKHYSWECFIFHDVDLMPEDDRNIYSCAPEPRHLSVAVNTFDYKLPYPDIFGGVSAMTAKQMESVNGYSNQFFGWGAEDDDMSGRILTKYRIFRYPASIARYRMLRHRPDTPNARRFNVLRYSAEMRTVDGLSNLQYKLVETQKKKLYTHIRVTYNETLIRASIAYLSQNITKLKRHKH